MAADVFRRLPLDWSLTGKGVGERTSMHYALHTGAVAKCHLAWRVSFGCRAACRRCIHFLGGCAVVAGAGIQHGGILDSAGIRH